MPTTNSSPWKTLSIRGKKLNALPLPENLKPLQLRFIAASGQKVIWVRGGEIQELPLEGIEEWEGRTYLTIPLPEDRALHTFPVPSEGTKIEYSALLNLLEALKVIEQNDPSSPLLSSPLQPGAIFISDAGGTAFLDPEYAQQLLSLAAPEMKIPQLANESLKGAGAAAFSTAVLFYRGLTGFWPFSGEEEELRERIQRGVFAPPSAHRPDLISEAEDWIIRGLSGSSKDFYGQGLALLHGSGQDLSDSALSPEQKNIRRQAALKKGRIKENRLKNRRFFRRRGVLILVAAAALGILGSIGGTIIGRITAPPISRGWEQIEVVEAFYRAVNDLDHETLDGITTRKAAKERKDTVLNLYATSRIVMGYEGRSPYVNIDQWIADGKHALKQGELLRGITDLTLEPAGENRFRATYQEWISEPPEGDYGPDDSPPLEIKGHIVSEIVTLEWYRDAWVIAGIEVESVKEIDYP